MIIKKITSMTVLAATVLMAGCQTSQGLYHWGEYESGLYGYYKDPAQLATLSEQLLTAIEAADGRVAPGMYAEYGTLLLQQGKKKEAIAYYSKEKELWPESRHLMDAMINNLAGTADISGQGGQ
ncbi:DUF4810 domain-containing protein [Endozoicomonas sp. YOMI1]|uniref:DUF4810 domain-containing protein n=1 Tax=Endozoicomonas sp. YOMI1 TaxID=2828739 RepID=UPI0021496298|nr:DUF4810 domain-containing protein [Endozoicomonas sp. YOMI1]